MTTQKSSTEQPTLFERPLTGHVQMITISSIRPPDTTKINASIRKVGILQPVLLRELTSGEYQYEVIEGNRRVHSALHFGIKEVPAQIVQGVSNDQANAARLITNTLRSENPLHEARALLSILQSGLYADLKSMAKDLDLPLNKVKKLLKLAQLPKDLLQGIEQKNLSVSAARNIAKLAPDYREKAIKQFREKVAQGETFSNDDLKEIRVGRATDLATHLEKALEEIPALTPLLSLNPSTLLAQEVQILANNRSVSLSDLITELQKLHKVTEATAEMSSTAPQIVKVPVSPAPIEAKAVIPPVETADIFAGIPGFGINQIAEAQNTDSITALSTAPEETEELPATFMTPSPRLRTTVNRK